MKKGIAPYGLVLTLVVAVGILIVIEQYFTYSTAHENARQMNRAADLAARWFNLIGELKESRGIPLNNALNAKYRALIGDDYTDMTTTLGSLEAKETSANPDFAALMVRLMTEAGIDSTGTVGVTLSGSFPALGIATLAAIQTIGARAVVISSLGASTYGANQPGATWIDMEKWLIDNGGLKYTSSLVTYGADNDNAGGILEEGAAIMRDAARRNNYELWIPSTWKESMNRKMSMLLDSHIALLVNIGGNQTCLGTCAHSSAIPEGFHADYSGCGDVDRGLIARLAERNIPFIHLLNIKDLACRYGLPLAPGNSLAVPTGLYTTGKISKVAVVAGLVIIIQILALSNRLSLCRN
nr:poly-gamma-glutamate system protein [candidate division Zixibacteria bacterium]